MDRGEIGVEEESRVRAKRVPVLPTDKEKDENEIMHMTMHSQCETEDSHRCSPKESPVPRVTMDRGPFSHDVYMEICQVLHESSETRAVNGVVNLDTCGLGEVLPELDVRQPSMGRTRRKDDGKEVFEVICINQTARARMLCKDRNASD